MLTYHLKPHDQQPLYEQLYHAVRADIMSGALPGGTRLPSKRQLAANLRVSQITVETAYGQLAAEGYIASAPRRGYFVQEQLAVPVSEQQESPAPTLPPISASEETYPYDFRTDFVDNGCFPFSTWARLSRSVLSEYSSALLRATDPCGAAELREEIVRYLHDFRGINVSPDNILIGAGSEYLMHLVIQLLGRDRVYALENPGYRKLYQIFAVNGVTVRPTPLDKHGLRADALAASDASVVYLTPSHHFPLGTVMTAARRLEILRWASEAPDRYIIEDDYDSEFRYASRPIPALGELDRTGRVVYVNTFAKSLAPGLRIGYLVLPNALMARYRERFSRSVRPAALHFGDCLLHQCVARRDILIHAAVLLVKIHRPALLSSIRAAVPVRVSAVYVSRTVFPRSCAQSPLRCNPRSRINALPRGI